MIGNACTKVVIRMPQQTIGERLAAIREKLGYSTRHVAKLSEGTVSHSLIGKLERGAQSLESTSWGVIKGLARAYHMTPEELLDQVQGKASLEPVSRITRTINVYNLADAHLRGHKDIVGQTEIDASLPGIYEAYIIRGEQLAGLIPLDCIAKVRRQEHAEPNDLVIIKHPEHGVVLRRFLIERAGQTRLATGSTTETLKDVTIIGKVVSYEIWLEPLPTN